jgi:hypothetical protein
MANAAPAPAAFAALAHVQEHKYNKLIEASDREIARKLGVPYEVMVQCSNAHSESLTTDVISSNECFKCWYDALLNPLVTKIEAELRDVAESPGTVTVTTITEQ